MGEVIDFWPLNLRGESPAWLIVAFIRSVVCLRKSGDLTCENIFIFVNYFRHGEYCKQLQSDWLVYSCSGRFSKVWPIRNRLRPLSLSSWKMEWKSKACWLQSMTKWTSTSRMHRFCTRAHSTFARTHFSSEGTRSATCTWTRRRWTRSLSCKHANVKNS